MAIPMNIYNENLNYSSLYDNANNQLAFRPNSLLDNRIKTMNEMEKLGIPQPNLQKLKDMDMKQFQEEGIPLSLSPDNYTSLINESGYPLVASTNFNIPKIVSELNAEEDNTGIMQMQNRGTLTYPEVNWKMITQGPNMRGGLIPNPDFRSYEEGEHYNDEVKKMIFPQQKPDRTEYDDLDDDLKALSYVVNSSNNTEEEEENKFLEFLKSMGRGTLNYMTGLPFVGTGLKFIGDQFRYRPANRGVYGYSAAELDRMNARGGWYSEPARAARRWEKRQSNILNRAAAGKPVGNVDKLLGAHGYTSDGSGGISFTGQPEGDRTAGAGYSRSDDSWSSSPFAQGGLASLWQR